MAVLTFLIDLRIFAYYAILNLRKRSWDGPLPSLLSCSNLHNLPSARVSRAR